MKIETKFFGEISIEADRVLTFEEGILGFEEMKRYALLDLFESEDFVALQSLDEASVAFILVRPWTFFPEYQIQIPDEELSGIGITEEEQLLLFNVVTISETLHDATANLLAPVVVNIDKRLGKQYVLREESYTTRHRIFPEEKV